LAVDKNVSASTQNQALSALLFLYKDVLDIKLEWISDVVLAKRAIRLPVVLSQAEVALILKLIKGTNGLMARLMYGTGMRLMEVLRLRVKDVDFSYKQILVRSDKADKDRVTLLPESLLSELQQQIEYVRGLHKSDLVDGYGRVELPFALARKYPNACVNLPGSMCFHLRNGLSIRVMVRSAGTILMKKIYHGRFVMQHVKPVYTNRLAVIRYVIRLPHICWSRVTISGLFRSCLATGM